MKTEVMSNDGWLNKQAAKFEETRFASMTLMMTAGSCIASVAAMMAMKVENYFLLGIITVFALASNGAFIAQAPAKWCITIFYSTLVVALGVFLAGLYMYL